MKILFVGHNTFRLTLDSGITLLTDPWFKMSRLWRKVPPALAPEELGTINYLLSSHNHLDHIDTPSLDLARRQEACVIGSERVARRARKAGVKEVVAMRASEEKDFPGFSVLATPAFHPLAKDAIGFLLRAEGKQIYFSGDTRLQSELTNFLKTQGHIDLAFLQASCARYFGKLDGLDQQAAIDLALEIKPRLVIPMHLHATLKTSVDLPALTRSLSQNGIPVKLFSLAEEFVW